jgi:hypothetical protein
MNSYSTIRNTGLAAVLVATLAGIVSNGLALDQKVIYERDILSSSAAVTLPEVVVIAKRIGA